MYDFLIVGAGFSGSVIAERLANSGKNIWVIDKRKHIGGNCYDHLDSNGIIKQKYGPHIFHTSDKNVWKYISKFVSFNNYKHKVISFYKDKYFPIPINRDTVNRFYGINLKSEDELKKFLKSKKVKIDNIKNSRDVVISKFGEELYEAFVRHYTKKQWDLYPEELDKSVLERLPIRYNKDPYYFNDKHQGMPIGGFTNIIDKMLKSKNITIKLGVDFFNIKDKIKYKKLIFTGKVDDFFSYKYGKLDYRCIDFRFKTLNKEDFQPNSVVNYTGDGEDFTRITEFKKFYPNMKSKKTVLCWEYPTWKGEPSYPVMNDKNKKLSEKYIALSNKSKNVYFAGRLGTFRYLNIDKAIGEALILSERILSEDN